MGGLKSERCFKFINDELLFWNYPQDVGRITSATLTRVLAAADSLIHFRSGLLLE